MLLALSIVIVDCPNDKYSLGNYMKRLFNLGIHVCISICFHYIDNVSLLTNGYLISQ